MLNRLTDRWSRLSFRPPVLIVMFAAITGLVGGSIAYYFAREGFINAAKERVELVRNERARAITALVQDIRIGLASLVTRPGLARDIRELSAELQKLGEQQREVVVSGYTVKSAFPMGSRSAVHDLGDGTGYSAKHKAVHDRLLTILQLKQLDDLLLVDLKGEVVYTVTKEPEFGTNLLSGLYRDTGAGRAFRRALAAQPPWEQVFVDMAQYDPTGGPAAFMAQAVRDDEGIVAGVLIFQLNNPKFREVANHIQDLGETGEVYLVGADATRRSNTRFSDGALVTEKLTNEAAVRSAAGFTATTLTKNYKGTQVIVAYAPLDLMGVRWGIVSNIELAEALAPLNAIAITTTAGVLLSTFVIALLGYASARRISRPLDASLRVMEKLSSGNLHVEIEEGNGIRETRQISAALRTFRGNLVETERLMAEVTKSQAQMGSLLDSSPTGAIVVSDGEVLYANDPATAILGLDKATFIGGRFSFADIAVSEAEARRIITTGRRDGAVNNAELAVRVPHKGDAILSLSVRRTTYLNRDSYLVWFHDITEQRQATEELQRLNDRFVAFLESTPDLVAIKDVEGRYQAASQSLATFAGVGSWRDFLGKRAVDLFPGQFGKSRHDVDAEILRDGKNLVECEEFAEVRGQAVWLATKRVALRAPNGDVTGVLSLSRDITAKRKADEELASALRAADTERQRSRNILDSSPDPVVIVRRDGNIDYVNKQTTEMLGYQPSELIGQTIERLVPARAHKFHGTHVKHFFNAGQAREMGTDRELVAIANDGREIPVEISLSPMSYGEEKLVIASVRDVTERNAAATALQKAKDAA